MFTSLRVSNFFINKTALKQRSFLEIPEQLFSVLSKSEAAKKMKSLLEVNISFTAYESKVLF